MAYRFRLTFGHPQPGFFRFEEETKDIQFADDDSVSLVARNSEKLVDATRFHFEAGGFADEAAARARGNQLRAHMQVINVALGLGLEIPTEDHVSARVGDEVKRKLAAEHGVTAMDSVAGLAVFPDDGNRFEYVMDGRIEVSASDPNYVLDAIKVLWPTQILLTDQQRDALELLGRATSDISPRARFLLSYLALEQVVKRESRSDAAKELLAAFVDQTKSHLPETEASSLVGALRSLAMNSFSSALRQLAAKIKEPKEIAGRPLAEFFSECIAARNEITHSAKANSDGGLASLSANLQRFVLSVIWTDSKLPPVSFAVPPSTVSVPTMRIFVK